MHCQSRASHRRDEILGTTLKDFRQFAEVLAAVRDKGQVVAVTSGEQHWGQRGMWEEVVQEGSSQSYTQRQWHDVWASCRPFLTPSRPRPPPACLAADKLEAANAERPGFFAATKKVL